MPLHKDIDPKEWAALHALGALAPEEKLWFEQHLREGCGECSAEVRSFQEVVNKLAIAERASPPAALRDRLLARVADLAAAASTNGTMQGPPPLDPPGVLFQRAGLLISRSDDMPWRSAPLPGVSSKILYVDAARKYCTSLVRMDPGACYPAHRHNDVEEVFLLEGEFLVEGMRMRPGDYCRSEPGSIHSQSKTDTGALLLVVASQTDEILS